MNKLLLNPILVPQAVSAAYLMKLLGVLLGVYKKHQHPHHTVLHSSSRMFGLLDFIQNAGLALLHRHHYSIRL